MSDEATPQEESEPEAATTESEADAPQASPAAETASPKKSRSPAEKVIVWGGITVLVLLVAFQAQARIGHSSSASNIKAAMKKMEEGGDELTLVGARKLMKGMWTESTGKSQGITKPIVFRWRGLQTYSLTVNVETIIGIGEKEVDQLVLSYSTDDVDHAQILADSQQEGSPGSGNGEDEEEDGDEDEDEDEDGDEDGDGETDRPERPNGGRGSFDPFENDKDGDDKISLEEAPDWMKERFGNFDTNKDGFLDKEEWENRSRRPRGGGEGGRGGDRGGRPQRPSRPQAADDADSGDKEPAEDKKSDADDTKPDGDDKEKTDADS